MRRIQRFYWLSLVHFLVSVFNWPPPVATAIKSKSVEELNVFLYQERHRTKQLLAAQEILFPDLYNSLLTAMKPLMARDRVGLESSKMKKGNYEDFL